MTIIGALIVHVVWICGKASWPERRRDGGAAGYFHQHLQLAQTPSGASDNATSAEKLRFEWCCRNPTVKVLKSPVIRSRLLVDHVATARRIVFMRWPRTDVELQQMACKLLAKVTLAA